MKEFQTVLASNPDEQYKLLATQSIANLYYQQKDFSNAATWEQKVIQLDPHYARAYHNLATTLPPGGSIKLLDDTIMTQQELCQKAKEKELP